MKRSILKTVDFEFECNANPETWSVYAVIAADGINLCFRVTVKLVSRNLKADVDALLGLRATLHGLRDGYRFSYGGVVNKVDHDGFHDDMVIITATLVPAFALMAQRHNCRIFQNQSALEILQTLFSEGLGPHGASYDLSMTERGQARREYCVQYEESDLDFAQRLLQEEGINYYVCYDENQKADRLVLFDETHQLIDAQNVDGSAVFPFGNRTAHLVDIEGIEKVGISNEMVSSGVAGTAWNWKKAEEVQFQHGESSSGGPRREVYRPLQRRQDTEALSTRVQDEFKSIQSVKRLVTMETTAVGARAAHLFEMTEHPTPGYNGRYVILTGEFQGHCPDLMMGSHGGLQSQPGGDGPRYRAKLGCIPADTTLRPSWDQGNRKPRIVGAQTAKVTGPRDGEVNVDKHGRIQLQFYWDRRNGKSERVSCWVRVAQSWAGTGWGAQFIPRVGMEVIVEFIDGDPDRPIVTGTVYNGSHQPPFELPNNRTQSGFRTRSSDGSEGFNELRFDDLKGKEEIFLKGQKDWKIRIGDEKDEQVTGKVQQKYDNTHGLAVKCDQTVDIGGNQSVTVHEAQTLKVEGDVEIKHDTKLTHTVGSGGITRTVKGDIETNCDGKETRKVKKGVSLSASEGGAEFLLCDAFDVSSQTVTLSCGLMSIKITPSGIVLDAGPNMVTVTGTMIKLN